MKKFHIILFLFFGCQASKNINHENFNSYIFECEKSLKFNGIAEVAFEYAKEPMNKSSWINFYFGVDHESKSCLSYKMFFKNTNDTLKRIKSQEGIDVLTCDNLNRNLILEKKLVLKVFDHCNNKSSLFSISYHPIIDQEIRGH